MQRIALVTAAKLPDLDPDSRLLLPALEAIGIEGVPCVWSDESIDWASFPLTLIRSPWDYHQSYPEFLDWLARTEKVSPVLNPPARIRWNGDKVYMRELEAAGVPIVPTEWLPVAEKPDVSAVLKHRGWDKAVIKPNISAAGLNTEVITAGEGFDWARWRHLPQDLLMMAQPYVASINTLGELSLLFFNGEYSHAVIKKPAAEEFRIHEHFGGSTETWQATEPEIAFGRKVLDAVGEELLYARVDVVYGDQGELLLAELEIFEPNLYLQYDGRAASRLAGHIGKLLNQRAVMSR